MFEARLKRIFPQRDRIRDGMPVLEFRQGGLILADDQSGMALADKRCVDVPDVVMGKGDNRLAGEQWPVAWIDFSVVDNDEVRGSEQVVCRGRRRVPFHIGLEEYAIRED